MEYWKEITENSAGIIQNQYFELDDELLIIHYIPIGKTYINPPIGDVISDYGIISFTGPVNYVSKCSYCLKDNNCYIGMRNGHYVCHSCMSIGSRFRIYPILYTSNGYYIYNMSLKQGTCGIYIDKDKYVYNLCQYINKLKYIICLTNSYICVLCSGSVSVNNHCNQCEMYLRNNEIKLYGENIFLIKQFEVDIDIKLELVKLWFNKKYVITLNYM